MRHVVFPFAALAVWLVFGAGMALAASHHHRRHAVHHTAPIENLFPQTAARPAVRPESGPHRFTAD